MSTTSTLSQLIDQLDELALSTPFAGVLLDRIVQLLHRSMLGYNWVGFHLLAKIPGEEPFLIPGPYRGSMTPHPRIRLDQGICGAAASTARTVIVNDVRKDSRYLACSQETRSEIVVPVFVDDEVVAELDVESHFPAAFGRPDQQLCEHAANLVGQLLTRRSLMQ